MFGPFATYNDLVDVWRPLTSAEQGVAITRLDQASEYIRRQFQQAGRDVDAEVDATSLSLGLMRGITVDMVHRVMLNPDKMRTMMRSIDDWQRSWTMDNSISAGELYLSDNERSLLGLPTAADDGRRSFTIAPAYPSS